MSKGKQAKTSPVEETPIPSMLTNSASEMLKFFGNDIIEIEAEASLDNWNSDELMRDYGLDRRQLTRQKITLDYHEIRSEDGIENPLTERMADEMLLKVNKHLDSFNSEGRPDLAVSKLQIRVTSPEIEAATRAVSDEFELTFISDPAGDARGLTEEKNFGKGLYHELGFEYRNLNLRSVIETRAKYAEQSDGKLMGWGGPDDVRPRCSTELAQAVYGMVLPDEFRALKWYTIGENDVTELQSIEADRKAD
jgi:hypothetical protein